MNTYKNLHGAWIVSAIIDGYRVEHAYYGYTKREAVRLFRAEFGKAGAR